MSECKNTEWEIPHKVGNTFSTNKYAYTEPAQLAIIEEISLKTSGRKDSITTGRKTPKEQWQPAKSNKLRGTYLKNDWISEARSNGTGKASSCWSQYTQDE